MQYFMYCLKKIFRTGMLASLMALLVLQLAAGPAQAFFFGGVSLKDEKEMGHKFDTMIRANLPLVQDPEVSHYVEGLVSRLVRAIPPQPFTFRTGVILHPSLNAFAVPGGYVYVFTGLIMNLNNEGELAGVMAHELAHVTQRHVASRLERAQVVSIASLLLAVAGIAAGGAGGGALAVGAMGAGQSAMLNYSRIDENEADHIGLQYLMAAGYPPQNMAGGFKVLRQKSWMSGTSVPAYLSTHPDIGDRINGIMARVTGMQSSLRNRTVDNRRFMRVQTLLWARYGDSQVALQRFSRSRDGLSAMGKGIVYARRNDVLQATRSFQEALTIAPKDALVLREAGIFHYRKGDTTLAEKLLRQAMQLDRQDYMASFFYARLLDETGRATQADSYYRDVLRQVPEEADVHEAYARSLGSTGRTGAAYVHLAYSAIYANKRKLAKRYVEEARSKVRDARDKALLQRMESVYKERKEMWED